MNIRNLITNLALVSLVSLTANSLATEKVPDIRVISNQLSKVSWHSIIDDNTWRYTIETQLDTGNGKLQQRIQRYSPDLPSEQKWQLIEHQNQTPTPQILHEYKNTMLAILEEPDDIDISSSQIVNLDTLSFHKNTGQYYEYTFTPALPMFDKEDEVNFKGQLFVSKKNGEIEYLMVSLKESFKPSFTVNLSRYELKIVFSIAEGHIHVEKIKSHKQGKLMYVSEFNEKSVRLISDLMPVSSE